MLIKKNGKYRIISRGPENLIYEWNITISPVKKAWKLVNKDIKVGDILNGYTILSATTVYEPITEDTEYDKFQWSASPISEEEFDFAVYQSNLGYTIEPSFDQSYRCQLCDGIVANDVCTNCMFDWDS